MRDCLVEIDLKTFDKSIDNVMQKLSKLEKDVDKEIGRLTYFAGAIIVHDAKKIEGEREHRTINTGALMRSIHCAPAGASHTGDQNRATKGTDLDGSKGEEAKRKGNFLMVQVGSWLDYAYYVERGTKNMDAFPYLLPAFEANFKKVVDHIVKGLREILDKVSV